MTKPRQRTYEQRLADAVERNMTLFTPRDFMRASFSWILTVADNFIDGAEDEIATEEQKANPDLNVIDYWRQRILDLQRLIEWAEHSDEMVNSSEFAEFNGYFG
jgi:hypothetical protein